MSSSADSAKSEKTDRSKQLKKAKTLSFLTMAWNIVESACAIYFGITSNSVSLTGYGVDGAIETLSAAVMMWRLKSEDEQGGDSGARSERAASKLMSVLLILLCVYIVVDSATTLLGMQDPANASWPGIIITILGLIITPFLAKAKLKSSEKLNSSAQRADAMQTIVSCCLGVTTLLGLGANAFLGWSWADPVAALLFIPLILREAFVAFNAQPAKS